MEPVDILKMCFSNILYFKRKELNLSQGKMAEKCCMSLRQYADIESGKRFPSSISLINFIINGEIDINKFISDIQKLGYVPKDRVKRMKSKLLFTRILHVFLEIGKKWLVIKSMNLIEKQRNYVGYMGECDRSVNT